MRMQGVVVAVAAAVLMGVGIWYVSKPTDVPASGRLQLCATISPLADWLRAVAGPDAEVHCLVDGSKDPHHFEPSPQDAVRVSESRAVFSVGLNLDEWADKLVANAGRGDQLVLFETGDWIEARKLQFRTIAIHGTPKPGANPEEGHHHHGDGDPHYWNDPRRAMIVVRRMADELIKLDPAHKSGYEQRRDAYLKELEKLDTMIEDAAKKIPSGKQIVTFHDAYGYLFERLHVNVAAVVQVSPGVEPSLKDCTEALNAMRAINQRVVFKEPAGSDRAIEMIAAELGITQIEILDPLDNVDSPVGKTYVERMTHNIVTLEKTLQ